ncbi:MAG: hypothetical protein GY937_20765 [bacterium]|nr:hypothetical protein [bacterium]
MAHTCLFLPLHPRSQLLRTASQLAALKIKPIGYPFDFFVKYIVMCFAVLHVCWLSHSYWSGLLQICFSKVVSSKLVCSFDAPLSCFFRCLMNVTGMNDLLPLMAEQNQNFADLVNSATFIRIIVVLLFNLRVSGSFCSAADLLCSVDFSFVASLDAISCIKSSSSGFSKENTY